MSTAAAGDYEGGAGGKFRKKTFRRQATPYDRPVSALRNPVEGGTNNGWISKIVDPASRVITRSAQRLFSSVFRKALPAPETVTETDLEPRNEPSETISASENPLRVEEPVVNRSDNLNNCSDSKGIDDLEQILKQKTFTRAEIDHLTELLRSRTVDISAEDENKSYEPTTSQPLANSHKLELANVPVQENGVDTRRLLGEASVRAVCSSVLEEDIASPAELAKTYMGNRASKVSPSTLGLRSQVLREELPLVSNLPFPRRSSGLSLVPRSSVRYAGTPGVSENGYQTPKSQGRSAIYSMARTPYARIHSTAKGIGTGNDGFGGQSTSPWMLENNTLSIGKQVSKRRNSVFDNDIGSIGPIRRIRQKTNLMSPKSSGLLVPATPIPTPGTAFGSDVAQGSVSSTQKPLRLKESKHNIPKMRLAEDCDNSVPSTSFASVPSQSSEMARKILQQLDKLVPSPKEKSSELKLDIAREKSPAKLSVSMLHGQALRSVEEVDSSNLLNNIQITGTSNGVGGTSFHLTRDSASQKLDKVEENGPLKIVGSVNKLAPGANGSERTTLKKNAVLSLRTADSEVSNSVMTAPQRKRAFQMSVYEDSLELDDDSYSTKGGVHTAGENEKLEDAAVGESKAVATETVTVEKPPVSEIKTTASLVLNESSNMGASDGPKVNEKNPGFSIPVTSPSSTVVQPATPSQSPPLFSNVFPMKEPTAPMFNFGSKGVENAPPSTFTSPSSFSGTSGLKFGSQTILKSEASSSAATVADTATETIAKAAESDKGGKENALKTGDLFEKRENVTFSSVSTSTTPSIFSFNNSTNNSNLSNGSSGPSPLLFSVPASPSLPVSTSSANVIFSSGPMTTAITTSSSLSASSATPTFSSAPIFQFGSSTTAVVAPSSSMSQSSTTSSALSTDSEQKFKTTPHVGNLSPSSFGTTTSPLPSASSGIFGFTSVAPASTTNSSSSANNLSSNSFGAGTGPVFGSGTGSSPFTQSIPSQLGSSILSPTFGLSSSSTFSSGNSLFGSSTPASKSFSSGSGFGQNSSATFSTGSNPFSSSSGTANLFSSSSQTASSIFSPVFSSASSPTTGFSFGGTSTAGAATGSVKSPATGPSFGVSSTAGAASASTPATGFSFGGSSVSGAATGSAPMAFGSGIGASPGQFFSFTQEAAASSASLTSSQPVFGAPNPSITFSSSPANDQMSMEDSMAEDTIQASTPTVPTFVQPAATPSPGFMFNSAQSGSPFQFGAQQNPVAPQNSSPFQASGNFDFAPGGSFSLGTTGDKSNRRYIKAKRDKTRKK
ncbi:hypothetical protein NE237_003966 [Protea cynaroides]|uniref:Nuclear pore complex protein NUP1-like n=1 Tax=Protea cynaroides TaxID=273540 RepID=A0A9Q0KHX9_9MAGN|nr:hypothetical protein NE237_003966 [Protea cynaroides]